MGRNRFVIADPEASFGKEKTTRKNATILHLILSADAALDLRAAALEAAARERASSIECECRPYKREVLRTRYRWYPTMRWVVQATTDETPTRFDESTETPTLYWNRSDLPSLVRISEALANGDSDYAIRVGETLSVWIWGGWCLP